MKEFVLKGERAIMEKSKHQKVITTNYLSRFICLGGACEDHCCKEWRIFVDKSHYKKIKKLMSEDSGERQMFKDSFKLVLGENSSSDSYAQIAFDERTNCCSFLTDDALCGLQNCYGDGVLPNVCSVYPRYQLFNGKRIEIYGTLSCPEIARLCLLQGDAMYMIEEKSSLNQLFKSVISTEHSFYLNYLNEVRTVMVDLLNPVTYSINQRLFLTVFFAMRTESDFFKTLKTDPGKQLREHVEYIKKTETKEEIMQLINGIVFSCTNPLKIILAMLMAGRTTDYVAELIQIAVGVNIGSEKERGEEFRYADVYSAYKKRAKAIEVVYGKRLDQYFTNYSMNYWLSEWYTNSQDLVVHSRRLLVRIACLRFMLFSHKKVLMLLEKDNVRGRQDLLDEIAVEVFYRFSRMYEHNSAAIEKIEDDIIKYEYGLPVLASLIKF